MAFDFNGTEIATTANGYLENLDDWSEDLAKARRLPRISS